MRSDGATPSHDVTTKDGPVSRPAPWKLALLPLLIAPALVACGSDDSGTDAGTADGLAAVSVTGDVGAEPKVEWKDAMAADSEDDTTTAVTGDGPELTDADTALVALTIGNGFDKKTVYSSYTDGSGLESVDLSGADTLPVLKDNLIGATVGSRILVTANAKDVFSGAGNSSLGIGNEDPLLFVLDVLGPFTPSGTFPATAKGTVPGVTVDGDGKPTGLTFAASKPDPKLALTVVSKGTGPAVTLDGPLAVDYLGQVYGASKPFDQSYSKGQPLVGKLSGLVKGWQKELVGLPAGSRVLLSIPPKFGYGSAGQPSAGIKGTDTIVFAIDILAAG